MTAPILEETFDLMDGKVYSAVAYLMEDGTATLGCSVTRR